MTREDANNHQGQGEAPVDFIREIVHTDIQRGKNNGRVVTRFPPEPNGYLHIGHAKSICLNFGIAEEFSGRCHLRFDDTNPEKEEAEYVRSIQADVRWLGFDWGQRLYYASDYFEQLYKYAQQLVRAGKAYVCSLSPNEIKEHRGTLTEPGKKSPFRNRSVEENLGLLEGMRGGRFAEGAHVLRAKIDMAAANINMRDPILYRIRHESHHRRGDEWCIYPTYDWAHCLSDSIEGITHSICTLEFEDHRPLYDWILDELGVDCHPQQIEFARLNLSNTVLSKRKLLRLIQEGCVEGWDDPRMPTISGLRRRGYTPRAIRHFCQLIGVSKANSIVDRALLDYCVREELNQTAPRAMAVLRPLRLVIENFPKDRVEEIEVENNPEDESRGSRLVPFTRALYIERDDFAENPPKKFFRLSPGREVRLKGAYYVTCTGVQKHPGTGQIEEVRCRYDPSTRGGWSSDGRKVRGTLHWVSAKLSVQAQVCLYERLFLSENVSQTSGDEFLADVNPRSRITLTDCQLEPSLRKARAGVRYQFLRLGYFCLDAAASESGAAVFSRITPLRDTWSRIRKKNRS